MAERRKPGFRYSLRALLVVVTLVCLWGGYHTNRAWRERAAVSVLREHFAQIHEPNWPSYSPVGCYRKLVAVVWGERCVRRVSMNPELAPAEVEALVALPSLDYLTLNPMSRNGPDEPKFEDIRPVALPSGALERILATHSVRALSLRGCILSDDDLSAIAQEESLTFLQVGGPGLNDRHLGPILSLPRLESLQLLQSPASGKGLSSHPGSNSLTSFWSAEAPLGDECASFMAKCPNLRSANVSDARASIEFTRQLENHPSLEEFGFVRAGSAEVSIDSLLTIPRLNRLGLPQRVLTPEVRASIAQRRPTLIVRAASH